MDTASDPAPDRHVLQRTQPRFASRRGVDHPAGVLTRQPERLDAIGGPVITLAAAKHLAYRFAADSKAPMACGFVVAAPAASARIADTIASVNG